MKPLNYLPQADADLDEIHAWIAENDPRAASRTINRIVDSVRRLADFPGSGQDRPEVGKDVRSLVSGKYVILHRVGADSVDIVRIVHGARDLARLLISGISPDNFHDEVDWGPPAGKEFW